MMSVERLTVPRQRWDAPVAAQRPVRGTLAGAAEPDAAARCAPWIALLVLLFFGSACRVAQYAARVSYWHDEAYLVVNVFDKPADALLGPLDHHQAAPPAWLLLQRAAYVAFGPSEYVLRALPLACGLAALWLFGALAWRTLAPAQALWAVALFVLSDELIFQSANAKQYSGDVFVATLLLAIAFAWRPAGAAPARMIVLSLVAAPALWFAHPTPFVFGAISAALLPQLWRAGRRDRVVWLLGNAAVAASFFALYHVSVRAQRDDHLLAYWFDHHAFPNPAAPWALPVWLARNLVGVCAFPFGPAGAVVAALAACGAVGFWRDGRAALLTALLGAVTLVVVAAAGAHYPFDGSRVTLFLAPGLALLSGRGMGWAMASARREVRFAAAAGGAVLVVWLAGTATYRLLVPRMKSHVRPAVEYVVQRRAPGEALHFLGRVRSDDQELFAYWRDPPPPVHRGFDASRVAAGERFWIVAAYPPRHGVSAIAPELTAAAAVADELERYAGPGGAAIRFRARATDGPR